MFRDHGVASWAELLTVLSEKQVRTWVRNGHLRREYRGVYSLARLPQTEPGRILAAVKALEPDAAAAFRAAGLLHGVLKHARGRVDVTTPHRRRPQAGLIVHRRTLDPDERTVRLGIPVTSPERTLLDLATLLTAKQLTRAVRQAEVDRITTHRKLTSFTERRTRTPGAPALRAILQAGPSPTRSGLEDHVLDQVRSDPRMPKHEPNAHIHGHEVDLLFPAENLVVEIDGRKYHDTPTARFLDREKQRRLEARGRRVLRISEDDEALERIRDALYPSGSAGPRPSG